MEIRPTIQSQVNRSLAYIQQQSGLISAYNEQISSGLRVQRPSDSPSTYVAASNTRALARRFETYTQTISDASAFLNEGVAVLQESNKVLTRASQIASEGINGTTTVQASEALAQEVEVLLERMIDLSNSETEGGYLFGGTATRQEPFSVTRDAQGKPTAVAYQGAFEATQTIISNSQTVATRYPGNDVFQQTNADVFQTLIGLRDDLRNQSFDTPARVQALTQRMTQLENAQNVVLNTMGEQSAHLENLQSIEARVEDLHLNANIRLGELEAANFPEAVLKLREQETIFQATLAATAKLFDKSLLDFIR
jgi:flagellar hook-associated protein 3 FlgL